MALQVDNFAQLQQYYRGVMGRMLHHATNITHLAPHLLAAIVTHHEQGQPLEVRTYAGETANVLWMYRGTRRYALVYRHGPENNTGYIEVRQDTQNGPVIGQIDETLDPEGIDRLFRSLPRE